MRLNKPLCIRARQSLEPVVLSQARLYNCRDAVRTEVVTWPTNC